MLDCQARRLTQSTQQVYRSKILIFTKNIDVDYLQDITNINIRFALVALADRGLSGQTQNNIAKAVRAFFNFCVAEKLLPSSPLANVNLPKVERKVIQSLTASEVRRMLKTCEYGGSDLATRPYTYPQKPPRLSTLVRQASTCATQVLRTARTATN